MEQQWEAPSVSFEEVVGSNLTRVSIITVVDGEPTSHRTQCPFRQSIIHRIMNPGYMTELDVGEFGGQFPRILLPTFQMNRIELTNLINPVND